MRTHVVRVSLGNRSYPILIGRALIPKLPSILSSLKLGDSAFVITNAVIRRHYGKTLERALRRAGKEIRFETVPASEKSKSIATATAVLGHLARWSQGRSPFLIALGGGVVGDLTGFIAAVYKRGIPYIQIPTTLLGQVDSAIGGKTALDLGEGKNLIGAFYQPRAVLSDCSLLKTLPDAQITAALAEVIKYGLIRDAPFFRYLESHLDELKKGSPEIVEHVVLRCSALKAQIVSADETETKGLRTLLNFGHTIGHAIEAAAGYTGYNHGEAVALGMLAAARISSALGLLGEAESQRIGTLISRAGLPVHIGHLSAARIIAAHYHDKKFIAKKNRFVLLERIGRAKIVQDVPLEVIKKALIR